MIKPGELRAHGILFLRARPYFARTSGGEQQVILRLLERRATGTTNLTAVWTGPAADSFVAQHGAQSVSVSIYRDGADTIVQTMQVEGTR